MVTHRWFECLGLGYNKTIIIYGANPPRVGPDKFKYVIHTVMIFIYKFRWVKIEKLNIEEE